MPLGPEDVERQIFKEKIRGYDMEEVDAFLDRVVERMRELVEERDRLAREVQTTATGGEPAESEDADLLRRTLVTAQRAADQTLEEARAEADRLLADARHEAARERERLHEETEEVARAVEDLKRFRDDYSQRVRAVIADHLRVLDDRALPEVGDEADEAARRVAGAAGAGGFAARDPGEPVGRSALDTADDLDGRQDTDTHVGEY